jgi:hypothetical protein
MGISDILLYVVRIGISDILLYIVRMGISDILLYVQCPYLTIWPMDLTGEII